VEGGKERIVVGPCKRGVFGRVGAGIYALKSRQKRFCRIGDLERVDGQRVWLRCATGGVRDG